MVPHYVIACHCRSKIHTPTTNKKEYEKKKKRQKRQKMINKQIGTTGSFALCLVTLSVRSLIHSFSPFMLIVSTAQTLQQPHSKHARTSLFAAGPVALFALKSFVENNCATTHIHQDSEQHTANHRHTLFPTNSFKFPCFFSTLFVPAVIGGESCLFCAPRE